MDSKYVTVSSSTQNPSSFISNFAQNVTFEDGFEIALKSIYHAPLFNINNENNMCNITNGIKNFSILIPNGYYETNGDILNAINESIIKQISENSIKRADDAIIKNPTIQYTEDAVSLSFNKKDEIEFVVGDSSPLLRYLGYSLPKNIIKINVNNHRLSNAINPVLIYSSIVGHSLIDEQQSRLLAVCPLKSRPGYNFYEFQNPSYVPLAMHSLQDITFVVKNMDGNDVQFDYRGDSIVKLPTILNLHIRKPINSGVY